MKTLIRLGGIVLLALLAIVPSRAQLIIQPTVSASAGMFQYSYTVSNQTSNDVSIVTLAGFFNAADAVQNLLAPAGFLALFDPGLSLLSFIEDTQAFAAGTESEPFTFDSPYAPGPGTFEAIDVTGGILVGSTSVPTTAVPEPATTAAFGALALLGLVFHRKVLNSKSPAS